MADHQSIVVAAALILGYGLFSRLAERTLVTAPMMFVAFGVVCSPLVLGVSEIGLDAGLVQVLAEITLVVILFSDASTLRIGSVKRHEGLPGRLLFVGLPLTMVLGTIVAWMLIDDVNVWSLVLLACLLSPTDAALGQAVVSSPDVPPKVRETLNVESGLNDGIALPPVLCCIAALGHTADSGGGAGHWLGFAALQILLGPLAGACVGWVGGRLVERTTTAGWMDPIYQRLSGGALAILAWALAEAVHGNGFIAAFFAGLCLGTRDQATRKRMYDFGEAEGQLLSLFVFLFLGLVMVPLAAPHWDSAAWIYALLSLTVIRMLPVALALVGSGLDRFTVIFIGWFGPRGIASVLYLLIATSELGLKNHERFFSVAVLTVLLSVFLHGISAVPGTRLYGRVVGAPRS